MGWGLKKSYNRTTADAAQFCIVRKRRKSRNVDAVLSFYAPSDLFRRDASRDTQCGEQAPIDFIWPRQKTVAARKSGYHYPAILLRFERWPSFKGCDQLAQSSQQFIIHCDRREVQALADVDNLQLANTRIHDLQMYWASIVIFDISVHNMSGSHPE